MAQISCRETNKDISVQPSHFSVIIENQVRDESTIKDFEEINSLVDTVAVRKNKKKVISCNFEQKYAVFICQIADIQFGQMMRQESCKNLTDD